MSKGSSSKLVEHFNSAIYSKKNTLQNENHLHLEESDFILDNREMQPEIMQEIYNPNLMENGNLHSMGGVVGGSSMGRNESVNASNNQMSSKQMLAGQMNSMNGIGMINRPLMSGMFMQRPLPYKIPYQPQVLQNPAVQQQMDKAFDDAFQQANSWAKEYQASSSKTTEESANASSSKTLPPTSDQLAKTAGALASLISSSENQKFKNSKFLQMMEQLRDGEVGIEGDKLVQQISPANSKAGITIPDNFGISEQSADAMATDALISDFQKSQPDSEFMDRNINNQIPSSYESAQRFLAENGSTVNAGAWEERMQAPPRNYREMAGVVDPVTGVGISNQEHRSQQNWNEVSSLEWSKAFQERKATPTHVPVNHNSEQHSIPVSSSFEQEMRNRYSPDVSHDLDWAEDFKAMDLEKDSKREKELYLNDDIMQDAERESEKQDIFQAEQQWRELQRQYDLANPSRTYVEDYSFFPNNPYLQLPASALSNPMYNSSLTESILALEATVAKDPENSAAWFELGIKQQENENEPAAIAALQKAIEIDPSNINSYLAIAVSYTNENYTVQAQDSLAEWMRKHPKYSNLSFVKNMPTGLTSSENHEALTNVYVQAAMHSGAEVDADVQSALGVLFNINHDFAKAIDCFQTAVSVRPTDFQIWNKLGATLANSGEPEKAMEAYYNALQINQNYIRARYNLAIACMQIGQYQEAATYLLTALQIQEKSMHHVIQKSTPELLPEMRLMHSGQSDSVWSALRVLLSTYVGREDLVAACDAKDMTAFREYFEF